jgi:hypothetical protein
MCSLITCQIACNQMLIDWITLFKIRAPMYTTYFVKIKATERFFFEMSS